MGRLRRKRNTAARVIGNAAGCGALAAGMTRDARAGTPDDLKAS
jgi:hypothetical protein